MFSKKTYRKTRWIERVLALGSPTDDLDNDWDFLEGDELDEEFLYHVYDEETGEDIVKPEFESVWMVVNSEYIIRLKRGRWAPVKYFRVSYEDGTPLLECKSSADAHLSMKIYSPTNHIGEKTIFVVKADTVKA